MKQATKSVAFFILVILPTVPAFLTAYGTAAGTGETGIAPSHKVNVHLTGQPGCVRILKQVKKPLYVIGTVLLSIDYGTNKLMDGFSTT